MRNQTHQGFLMILWLSVTLSVCGVSYSEAAEHDNGCDSGQRGWDILTQHYIDNIAAEGAFDGISLQWDYFMVHDDDFTGSIGFVVANPRNNWLTSNLMPTGGSVAIAGKFLAGLNAGTMFADYYRFGKDDTPGPGGEGWYTASDTSREFYGEAPMVSGEDFYVGRIVVEGDGLRLSGRTDHLEWNLLVTQDWEDRCSPDYLTAFPSVTGYDAGGPLPVLFKAVIKNEFWTVDMNWMRMNVVGTITDRTTNDTFSIEGHGYRETAWGAWAFNFSGWDFVIASDETTGIQWSLQTYHHSDTLDYLDVSFYDGSELKSERFEALSGDLGWYHRDWKWDPDARQCLPEDMIVLATNDDYTVEATVDIDDTHDDNQIPMLSDLTPFTRDYTIVIRVAKVDVTITRRGTHDVVAQFQDKVGGGEFGIQRRSEGTGELTEEECAVWGGFYTAPLPAGGGCIDEDGDDYGLTGGADCLYEGRDCNDESSLGGADINPGAPEILGNGIDDDCDGKIDEACSTLPVNRAGPVDLIVYLILFVIPAGFILVKRRRLLKKRNDAG